MEGKTGDCQEIHNKKEKIQKKRNYGRILLIMFIASVIGGLYSFYVSCLFENDRNFSMLSELEREMSFQTEMGFYYSYFKTMVEEHPYLAAITRLMYDKQVEYPSTVNAFNRFNIHPEVMLGSLYRYMEPWLNKTVTCQTVYRGQHLPQVESCVGIGWPIYFYLQGVWTFAGGTLAMLFLFATSLSDSILGGLLAVAQYMLNHREATRVMWSPNERENFAYPLLLLQMWLVTLQLRRTEDQRGTPQLQVAIFLLNCTCLLFWQFTQFIFLTQTAIFFVMEQLKIIDLKTFCIFLHAHFCGLHMAVLLLQGNDMLKSSLYTSFFIVVSLYSLLFSTLRIKIVRRVDLFVESWLILLRTGIIVMASFSLKKVISDFVAVEEDTHIWEILLSKFFGTNNFHALLYVCSAVFDFMPIHTWIQLMNTALLPTVAVSVGNIVAKWYKSAIELESRNEKAKHSDTESDEDSGIENNVSEKSNQENQEERKDIDAETHKSKMAVIANFDRAARNIKLERKVRENEINKDPLLKFMKNIKINPDLFYNISQMVVFGVMATLVMRLKFLFVPQMCIISALIVKVDFCKYYPGLRRSRPLLLPLIALYIMYSIAAVVYEESSVLGEFSDPPQEELLNWIQSSSPQQAVFAGPMPLTAVIMLTTRRAIVNHPHYEHKDARDRTFAVYKAYGKYSSMELYKELTKLKVTYMVLDKNFCYGRSSQGCTYEYIWDRQSPHLESRRRLCDVLLNEQVDHFYKVFQNKRYTVYKLHDYSVRYMPRTFDT